MRLARGFWRRLVVFSDDNLVSDLRFARELFEALIPLRIWWASQCSIAIALNDSLLDLAVKSGCRGLFIGFETPNQAALDYAKANQPDLYQTYIDSPITNTPASVWAKGHWVEDVGAATPLYEQMWTEIKGR